MFLTKFDLFFEFKLITPTEETFETLLTFFSSLNSLAVFAINLGLAFTVSILTYGRLLSKFKSLNALLFKSKTKLRLVRPDGGAGPLFLVSSNYEKLLHWNRSLRFAISIGIFADKIKNEI